MADADVTRYVVWCEAKDHSKPLIMHDLTFAQVIDEIVVPLEKGDPFFIDGAPLTKGKIVRLKILEQKEHFGRLFSDLHWGMRAHSDVKLKQMLADQYGVRFEALLRESTRDVTSRMMSAFDTTVRPKLRDYLPNRQELISAAAAVFKETVKIHGGAS